MRDVRWVVKAKWLMLAMQERLELHISGRVENSRLHHYTLDFIWENLAAMATVKCIVGHVVDDYEFYKIYDCLLIPPKENAVEDVFQSI